MHRLLHPHSLDDREDNIRVLDITLSLIESTCGRKVSDRSKVTPRNVGVLLKMKGWLLRVIDGIHFADDSPRDAFLHHQIKQAIPPYHVIRLIVVQYCEDAALSRSSLESVADCLGEAEDLILAGSEGPKASLVLAPSLIGLFHEGEAACHHSLHGFSHVGCDRYWPEGVDLTCRLTLFQDGDNYSIPPSCRARSCFP